MFCVARRGLLAIPFAWMVCFSASASAAVPIDASTQQLSNSVSLAVSGTISSHCQLSGGGSVELGRLSGDEHFVAPFGLDCNVPFDIGVRSQRGGLVNSRQPLGEGPFSGTLLYDVRVSFPVLRPERTLVEASFNSMEITAGGVLSSGEGISAGGGAIELRTIAPSGAGLLAGRYTETLSLVLVPRI